MRHMAPLARMWLGVELMFLSTHSRLPRSLCPSLRLMPHFLASLNYVAVASYRAMRMRMVDFLGLVRCQHHYLGAVRFLA